MGVRGHRSRKPEPPLPSLSTLSAFVGPVERRDAAAVAGLSMLPFLAALGFGFAYDDHWTLLGNPLLDLSLSDLVAALVDGEAARRGLPDASRPTMLLSLWLDRHLLGGSALAHHASSLMLHGLACALAYLLARLLLDDRRGALLAGALFGIAPAHAEVVVGINYREDLLATAGVFGALLLLLAPLERPAGTWRGAIAALLLLFALGAKASALVFFPLALTLAFLDRRDPEFWRERESLLYGFGSALILWASWRHAIHLIGDGIPRASYPTWGARALATLDYERWAILGELLPVGARTLHSPLEPAPLLSALLIAGALVLLATMARRANGRRIASALAIVLLAPLATSPLVGPVNVSADRYLYPGILGGAMLWALLAGFLLERLPLLARRMVVAALLLSLGLTAHHHASAWESDLALFERAARHDPELARAHRDLSWARRRAGDAEGALLAAERALTLRPGDRHAVAQRALSLLALGRVEEARQVEAELSARPGEPARGLSMLQTCLERPAEESVRCAIEGP